MPFTSLGQYLEDVRPWLTTFGTLVTGGGVTGFYIALRKSNIEWFRVKVDQQKVEVAEDDGIRDHYATELASLRQQILASGTAHLERQRAADERYNAAMRAADDREEACLRRVDALTEKVAELSNEVIGLRRILGQSSRSAIVLATHAPSMDIQTAADNAANALDKLERQEHGDHQD